MLNIRQLGLLEIQSWQSYSIVVLMFRFSKAQHRGNIKNKGLFSHATNTSSVTEISS